MNVLMEASLLALAINLYIKVYEINHLNINGRSLLEFLSVTLMFEAMNFKVMATLRT